MMIYDDVVIHCLKAVLLLHCLRLYCHGLIVEGDLKTKEDWAFITRFCYRNKLGSISYYFEYPKTKCCQKSVLYYDVQWPKVYKVSSKCEDKLAVTIKENNQMLSLDPNAYHSGCSVDGEMIVCKGSREFVSSRSRWWYVALSNCGKSEGVQVKYRLEMTNGNTFWTKHFSADESNIIQPNISFMIVYLLMLACAIALSSILKARQLFHYTYQLFMWSVFFEFVSLIFNVSYYVSYGQSGYPKRGFQIADRGFHSIGDIVFLVLLILLGKGWTVTRGRISSSGQVKLGVFCTLYAIAYIALFIYEANVFDPGKVLYLYESPAGVGLCVLRTIAWIWFCYGNFFTLKHYPQKHHFYYPFWVFYTFWFLSGPGFVLIGLYLLDPWQRAQIVNGIDRTVVFLAHIFFLVLTRPSAANKNFPYTTRTTQVGVADGRLNQDFSEHPYAQSGRSYTDVPEALSGAEMKTFADISTLFRANTSSPVSELNDAYPEDNELGNLINPDKEGDSAM